MHEVTVTELDGKRMNMRITRSAVAVCVAALIGSVGMAAPASSAGGTHPNSITACTVNGVATASVEIPQGGSTVFTVSTSGIPYDDNGTSKIKLWIEVYNLAGVRLAGVQQIYLYPTQTFTAYASALGDTVGNGERVEIYPLNSEGTGKVADSTPLCSYTKTVVPSGSSGSKNFGKSDKTNDPDARSREAVSGTSPAGKK